MIRFVLITLIFGWLIYSLWHEVALGLRTGRIAYGRGRNHCFRSRSPVAFWCLSAMYGGLAALMALTWLFLLAPMLFKTVFRVAVA